MNNPVADYYSRHHREGGRLGISVLLDIRAGLFREWIGEGKKVVDLGCRDGTLTQNYCKGNEVTGCDIDNDALKTAADKLGIETQQVDLNSELPFDDYSFDVVVMAEVLEHLPYPDITLKEVDRILKTGGIFIGSVPLAYHMSDRIRIIKGKKLRAAADTTHLRFFSYDDLNEILSEYFELDEIVPLNRSFWLRFSHRLFAKKVAFKVQKKEIHN